MPYLIDGHNLIGKVPDISLDDPNDEAQLVQKLLGYVARTGVKIVVIFDHGVPAGVSRMSTRSVRVIFASPTSNADRVMIDRIYKARNPKEWWVVSSDNEVLVTARRRKMHTLSAAKFADMLANPPRRAKPGREEAANPTISKEEVDEWLRIFSER